MASPRGGRGLVDLPHHDGSEVYADQGPYALGDAVVVRLRVPHAVRADRVRVRMTPDAEPRIHEATIDREDDTASWWVAELRLDNPVTNYRFLLTGGSVGYAWMNEAGLWPHDVTDDDDFRFVTGSAPPAWLSSTVGYQIFLDRFERSGAVRELPDWAIARDWSDPVTTGRDVGPRQIFGGDLAGIEKRLDHLEDLGVTMLYLTPFFPAHSNHRYDASSFAHVDPLLGGDEALISLSAAAHARGMRIVGDITLNHTGNFHDWFLAAQADASSVEAGFYFFPDHPDGYVSWHDVGSLPKLDHRNDELARRLYDGDESVIARYLDPPFALDGWRVDCANTTGRHGPDDHNDTVANATRATMARRRADGWLLAEHCYDAGVDLRGMGWHGSMAYQWFSRPLWSWLRGPERISLMAALELPRFGAATMVSAMRTLGASAPWSARQASMTMLDSHDSARFRTAVGGDRFRHRTGVAALLTMPGVPTLFAGSEVGVEGDSMDATRVPFPWDESSWDHEQLEYTRTFAGLRTDHAALQQGSMRWLDATDDTVTFVRETDGGSVVVHLARTPDAVGEIDLAGAGVSGDVTPLAGTADRRGESIRVGGDPATVLAID